jgi:hypothetical protein
MIKVLSEFVFDLGVICMDFLSMYNRSVNC